jgi:hypothetical protein
MFKRDNNEDELFRSMEKSLIAHQTEKQHNLDKVTQVTGLLSTASEIFDQAGMTSEADEILAIVEGLVKDLVNKK